MIYKYCVYAESMRRDQLAVRKTDTLARNHVKRSMLCLLQHKRGIDGDVSSRREERSATVANLRHRISETPSAIWRHFEAASTEMQAMTSSGWRHRVYIMTSSRVNQNGVENGIDHMLVDNRKLSKQEIEGQSRSRSLTSFIWCRGCNRVNIVDHL